MGIRNGSPDATAARHSGLRQAQKLYDRVQEIVAEELPVICLVSPNILVGAANHVGNFRAAILVPYALWNIEELYVP